jgi:tetratricopeptide (TPR) repeat protein
MSKRKSREHSTRAEARSGYPYWIRQADEIIAKHVVSEANPNGAEIRPDNWQQIALDWFTPREPERSALARYIAAHQTKLGVAWARELLRLEVFFQVKDDQAIVEHYARAFRAYPRCALIELWVAGHILRQSGDVWRVRQMYLNAAAELPTFAKPFYELGFLSYLLGDFPGALEQFDQAAALVAADDVELGARIFYNRGLVRFALNADQQAALADVEEALRRKPDYAQAKEALRAFKSRARWVPW